jgi:CRP-like cAMP-binding protein
MVYRQHAPLQRLHTVCSGLGALQRLSEHGQERTIRLVEPGDVMGLESLVGLTAQSNAVTLLPTHTCSVPPAHLLALARIDPWLSHTLNNLWMSALQRADFVIAELSTGSARARVARLLVHLAELCGDHGAPDLSRSDMASLMSLTVETVSRTMAALQRDGLVSHRHGRLVCAAEQLKTESAAG